MLKRSPSEENRRRVILTITKAGKEVIDEILPTIRGNRKNALTNCDEEELKAMNTVLMKIIKNCSK
jgi:DNA-binding MarR family transcriptional regulator